MLLALQGLVLQADTNKVWTYDLPGGEGFSSPDYTVTIESGGEACDSFVHYSYGLPTYTRYHKDESVDETIQFVRNGMDTRGTVSHSTAIFSFSGKITVRVRIHPGAKHITLPLKSAKVLPSSYDIPCRIENGNTIVFELDRPEKVAVIPNYDQAWKVFTEKAVGHVPIQNWDGDFEAATSRESFHAHNLVNELSEGYKNPLFVIAQPPEANIPDKHADNTLVIKPGSKVTQAEIYRYNTIWFEPGVHDLSSMGESPWYQTQVKQGQTIYIEGGAYVMARFKEHDSLGSGPSSIMGRGMVSGIKHKWITSFEEGSQIINIDTIKGIGITDRGCFGTYGGHLIKDVAMLGTWYWNSDGPDYTDHCLVENCFLMGYDDCLKLNDHTHARHIVIWQLPNAHAMLVKEMRDNVIFSNTIVEDADVIMYARGASDWPWIRLSTGVIGAICGTNMEINNFTFRDIRIESPYVSRLFSFFNLDTNKDYTAPWFQHFPKTTPARHTRIDGLTFENITVTSPLIVHRSLLGSAYPDSFKNVRFINLNVNGTMVTESNKDEFFEILYDMIDGLSFSKY